MQCSPPPCIAHWGARARASRLREGVDSWEACYPTDAYGASPEARHSADELHMTPIEPSLWDEQGPKEGLFTSRSLRYPEKGDRGSRGD